MPLATSPSPPAQKVTKANWLTCLVCHLERDVRNLPPCQNFCFGLDTCPRKTLNWCCCFVFFLGCLAFWCFPCFACKTAHEAGECLCLPLLDSFGAIPPITLAMRVSIRQRYGIEVGTHFHNMIPWEKKNTCTSCLNACKPFVNPNKSQCCLTGLSEFWSGVNPFMQVPR